MNFRPWDADSFGQVDLFLSCFVWFHLCWHRWNSQLRRSRGTPLLPRSCWGRRVSWWAHLLAGCKLYSNADYYQVWSSTSVSGTSKKRERPALQHSWLVQLSLEPLEGKETIPLSNKLHMELTERLTEFLHLVLAIWMVLVDWKLGAGFSSSRVFQQVSLVIQAKPRSTTNVCWLVLVGICLYFFLPSYPETSSWLTSEEKALSTKRLRLLVRQEYVTHR